MPRARLAQFTRDVAAQLDPAVILARADGLGKHKVVGLEHAQERARCLADPVHWIENHVWLIDPKLHPEEQKPFKIGRLWPRQRVYVRWLVEGYEHARNRTVVKSREVGASWLAMALLRWMFWRYENFSALVFSAREDKVDDRTPSSLLGKVRFIEEHLPEYLQASYNRNNSMLLENEANGSVIVGQATSGKLGRGGRYSVVFGDEWAHVDHSLQRPIVLALASTTRSWWRVSTGNGPADDFAFTLKNAQEQDTLKLDYWTDPRRTQEDWEGLLVENGGGYTEVERAQEFGCSLISVSGLRIFRPPLGEDSDRPRYELMTPATEEERRKSFCLIAMDFGSGPSWTVALWLVMDPNVSKMSGQRKFFQVRIDLERIWQRTAAHEIAADILGTHQEEGYNLMTPILGDPAGASKGPDQESWESKLRAAGLPIRCLPAAANEKGALDLSLRDLQVLMDLDLLGVHPERAPITCQALELWEWDVPKGIDVKAINRAAISPKKDGWSHPGNAAQYGWMAAEALLASAAGRPLGNAGALPESASATLSELYSELLRGATPHE